MNLNDHEEQIDSLEVKFAPKRSVLLLVLCILTWLYCLYLLFIFVLSFFWGGGFRTQLLLKNSISNYFWVWHFINGLIVPLFCAFGALLMFLRKKIGFWIYTVAQLVSVSFSVYTVLGVTRTLGPGLFFGIFLNLIPLAFIVAYATQVFARKQQNIDLNF